MSGDALQAARCFFAGEAGEPSQVDVTPAVTALAHAVALKHARDGAGRDDLRRATLIMMPWPLRPELVETTGAQGH